MSAMDCGTRAGKYLTFDLNGERYGIGADRVVAIIGIQPCTPLPQARSYIKGLTMLRGKVLPVIDARLKLGMQAGEDTPETCIVLLTVGAANQTGIIVDGVHDVMDIAEDHFDSLANGIDTDGITGIAKIDNKVITILDSDELTSLS